jgi:hypothetical protein
MINPHSRPWRVASVAPTYPRCPRAALVGATLHVPSITLALVALALLALGLPAWLPVAIAAAAWFALWLVVAALCEAQITAWARACPIATAARDEHAADMAAYEADMARRRARDAAMPWMEVPHHEY